jgi:hypothetical protein
MIELVHIPNRRDIERAAVVVSGVYLADYKVRGIKVDTVVTFTDGSQVREVYDEFPGWNVERDFGGLDPDRPYVKRTAEQAAEWLVGRMAPPEIDGPYI